MQYPLAPAILYLSFSALEEIPVRYMQLTQKVSPLDRAPLDTKLWLTPPLSTLLTTFLLIMRPMRWAFLIYLGFQTVWYYPLIIFGISILSTLLLVLLVQMTMGLRFPTLLSFIGLPILGVWMWITI